MPTFKSTRLNWRIEQQAAYPRHEPGTLGWKLRDKYHNGSFTLQAARRKAQPKRLAWNFGKRTCSCRMKPEPYSTGVSLATLKASHLMPCRGKLICARASSPEPSSTWTLPSPNLV